MLLELLTDFQISIPELGRFEARTRPGRAADLQQHARAHRGAQAPLPVPLARLPRARARARDRPPPRARAPRDRRPQARRGHRDGARARPQEAAVDRRVDRLGARAAAARRRRHRRPRASPRRCRSSSSTAPTSTSWPSASASSSAAARPMPPPPASRSAPRCTARGDPAAPPRGLDARACSSSARSCAARAWPSAPASCSTPSRRCREVRVDASPPTSARRSPRRWPSRRRTGASSTSSSTASSSAPPSSPPSARASREGGGIDAAGAELDLEALRQQIAQALRDGDEGAMRDLARLAIAAFGRQGEGSGVIGVDVQRIRRALGLRAEPQPDLPREDPARRRACRATPSAASRRTCASELERRQIERTRALPPARPLNELDRALPSGPLQDLAAVHRVVAQLKRRLTTQGHELRGRKRHAHVDVRRTMRASLETGGVPVVLKLPPAAPAAPRDLRALRRLDERHERERLLPLRPARAARLVSQDALVRLHRAHQRGHRRLRARARLQGGQRGDRPRRRRRRHLRLHRLRARLERVRASSSRTTCTRARP